MNKWFTLFIAISAVGLTFDMFALVGAESTADLMNHLIQRLKDKTDSIDVRTDDLYVDGKYSMLKSHKQLFLRKPKQNQKLGEIMSNFNLDIEMEGDIMRGEVKHSLDAKLKNDRK